MMSFQRRVAREGADTTGGGPDSVDRRILEERRVVGFEEGHITIGNLAVLWGIQCVRHEIGR